MSALVDTGPLVAIVRSGEPDGPFYATALDSEGGELLTTSACLVEAMHFLRGWFAQERLFDLLPRIGIGVVAEIDLLRIRHLMGKYHDTPMDFADATLVTLAETAGIHRIITSDLDDFVVYRIHNRLAFDVVSPDLPL